MSTKSREHLYGHSIRYSAERAKQARLEADKLACVAWNQRMLGYKGPAQPSPLLGDALNPLTAISKSAASVAIPTKRLPSTSCGDRRRRRSMNWNATCAAASAPKSGGYPYKRSHLVAL